LNTVDFNTKREIIRALVKRIEIHKDEILVVFRVDPDPDVDTGENSTDSHMRRSSMQDRTRRHDAPLWRTDAFGGLIHPLVHDARLPPSLDELDHPWVADPSPDQVEQGLLRDVVERRHDTLPISKTFRDPSRLFVKRIRSKAERSRR
jgi:site-specific DNA recombinase